MFLRNFKCVLVFLLLSSAALAEVLPLSRVVETALKNNQGIISARKNWEAAQAKIPSVLSLPDPQVGVEYEQIPLASGNLEDGMKMYTLSQMVMFPGKIASEYAMAQAEARMFLARYQAQAAEIAAEVKSAYFDLYLVDRTYAELKEIRDYLSKIKKIAEAKYIVGQTMQSDLLQANIEYLMLDNELKNLEQERKVKELELKVLLNQDDPVIIEVESDLMLPKTLEVQVKLEENALQNRPELSAMQAELKMKEAVQQKAQMEFFPDMMLGYKRRVAGSADVMFSFSLPLYFWKQNSSLTASRLEEESSEADYNNMQNMTRFEVKEVWVEAESALRTAKLYEGSILPQSLQAFKVGLAAYQSALPAGRHGGRQGKTDFTNLLQLARVYKEAKLKYYENQVKAGKALAKLTRLTGKPLDSSTGSELGVKEMM